MRNLSESASLDIEGRAVPLAIRRSRRARRMSLRVDPTLPPDFPVELVLPHRVGLAEGLRFAHEMRGWIARRLAVLPPPVKFADGLEVEFGDTSLIIRHVAGRGPTRREGDTLLVCGAAEHLARRVRDWLRAQARDVLAARSHALAARLGREVRRIRLGDPKSRWGSCAPGGALAYSWRLILAPPFVLDYVGAHEVAHLVHPHHGPRFWRQVRELCADIDAPRAWLNRHGPRLLRYGQDAA